MTPHDRQRALAARLALFQESTPVEIPPLGTIGEECAWPNVSLAVPADETFDEDLDWPELTSSSGQKAARSDLLNDFQLDAKRLRRH